MLLRLLLKIRCKHEFVTRYYAAVSSSHCTLCSFSLSCSVETTCLAAACSGNELVTCTKCCIAQCQSSVLLFQDCGHAAVQCCTVAQPRCETAFSLVTSSLLRPPRALVPTARDQQSICALTAPDVHLLCFFGDISSAATLQPSGLPVAGWHNRQRDSRCSCSSHEQSSSSGAGG